MRAYKTLCSLAVATNLFVSPFSQAQNLPVMSEYSGVLRFSNTFDARDGKLVPFDAVVLTKGSPGRSCRLFGRVLVEPEASGQRILIIQQGSLNIACEGEAAKLILGDFVHSSLDAAWAPPQKSVCLVPTSRGTGCLNYGTRIEAGTYASWQTWHVVKNSTFK